MHGSFMHYNEREIRGKLPEMRSHLTRYCLIYCWLLDETRALSLLQYNVLRISTETGENQNTQTAKKFIIRRGKLVAFRV